MAMFSKLMVRQDWQYVLPLIFGIVHCFLISSLFFTVCTKIAYLLGDPCPKLNGRGKIYEDLEPVGFLLFVTTGLGWGKPFPLQRENLKKPQRDVFLILCSGVFACLLFTVACFFLSSLVYSRIESGTLWGYLFWSLLHLGILSFGFALSQFLPLPFFGMYTIVFPYYGNKIQDFFLKWQKQWILSLAVFLWTGYPQLFFSIFFGFFIQPLCEICGIPFAFVDYYFL
ncbi:MAG: hypothetical protein R3Y63_00990 [Eubacteriales bacterium]